MPITPQHAAALEYALGGWAVFPCVEGGKAPDGELVHHGHLDATTDPSQIAAWWRVSPHANVGVAVGPSNLCVLDVDVAEGKPGRASLAEIDAELPDTLTAITGRGGLHAIYTRGDAPVGRKIAFKPGLDLLGDGYIIVAPSVLKNGGAYRWRTRIAPAPVPQILARALVHRDPPKPLRATVREDIGSGGRNTALFRLGAALRDFGVGREAIARALDAENQERCKPPIDDGELLQIVDSVWRRVQPTRDVASGAVIEQEIQQIFAPEARSAWLEDVAAVPHPPMIFYPTGFDELDTMIGGGFATRQLCGVIGPPSAGKSALVGHWLLGLTKHRPVLHCSTELPRYELFVRYAAHKLSFPWREGLKGKVLQADMAGAVKGTRIKLLGCDDLDRNDPLGCIEAEMERMTKECGIAPVLAIDYIQMMARGATSDMRHKVGELTMRARVLSQVFDTVALGVFSTQRQSYGGKAAEQLRSANDPTAYLGAAKESGDIEFDCATLMYLDVDKLHEGNPKPGRIAVARCRVGDVGFVGVRAQLDIGKFWCDPSATAEMGSEAQGAKREAGQLQRDCDRLVEMIKKMPGRAWREVRTACGGHKGADAARAALLSSGVIELRKEDYYDSMHRKRSREIIALVGIVPSPISEEEPTS